LKTQKFHISKSRRFGYWEVRAPAFGFVDMDSRIFPTWSVAIAWVQDRMWVMDQQRSTASTTGYETWAPRALGRRRM
jgi:hypothetical protein